MGTSCNGCSRPECKKMKSLLRHRNECRVRASGGCDTCQRILCLLQMHARRCTTPGCEVLYCAELKRRIKENEAQRRGNADRCPPAGASSSHRIIAAQNGAAEPQND